MFVWKCHRRIEGCFNAIKNTQSSSFELSKCSKYGNWFTGKLWTNFFKMGTNNQVFKKKCRRHFESVWQQK